ncbi:hypothetical protein MCERE10_02562 [Burkholderiaceae bacterium]
MSLREDFEQALALHITHLLRLAADRKGGVYVLLNELFYSHTDHDPMGEVEKNLLYRKRRIEKALSTPAVEVTLQTVALNSARKPRFIFGVMFNENEDVAWPWRIDSVAVTLEPDDSYEIEYWRFSPKNPWPTDFSEDDPTWSQYRKLITGDSLLKTTDPRL